MNGRRPETSELDPLTFEVLRNAFATASRTSGPTSRFPCVT